MHYVFAFNITGLRNSQNVNELRRQVIHESARANNLQRELNQLKQHLESDSADYRQQIDGLQRETARQDVLEEPVNQMRQRAERDAAEYEQQIDGLKKQLTQKTETAELLKKEFTQLKQRAESMERDSVAYRQDTETMKQRLQEQSELKLEQLVQAERNEFHDKFRTYQNTIAQLKYELLDQNENQREERRQMEKYIAVSKHSLEEENKVLKEQNSFSAHSLMEEQTENKAIRKKNETLRRENVDLTDKLQGSHVHIMKLIQRFETKQGPGQQQE